MMKEKKEKEIGELEGKLEEMRNRNKSIEMKVVSL